MTAAAAERVPRAVDRPSRPLDIAALLAEPVAIQRRLVRLAIERSSGRAASWTLVSALADLVRGGPGRFGRLGPARWNFLPARGLIYQGAPSSRPATPTSWPARDLPVPGAVEVPRRAVAFARSAGASRTSAAWKRWPAAQPGPGRGAPASSRDLVVRAWQPGDLMQVLGSSGRKKVQDLFVDRKVPRSRRHQVPIVTDAEGRIVWVAGLALGEAFRVTPATKSVVVLSFEPLGGPE